MTPARWLVATLGGAVALLLAVVSFQQNWKRACDLREWPLFSFCPSPELEVSEQVRDLQARIATNPGDSAAWLALALLTDQPGGVAPLDDAAVLSVAVRLAPQDAMLMRIQADRMLQDGQWVPAVDMLVRLVQEHGDPKAARDLAELVANPAAQGALTAALQPGTTWLKPVLSQLRGAGVPLMQAMPLVAEALPRKLVSASTGQMLMRELKAGGQWLEAQALWVYLVGGTAPLLYNGSFEQAFIADGFDWEMNTAAPSKTGVHIERPPHGERGRVLLLDFTGRPVAQPMVWQALVLPPGRYQFTGDYMSRQMRTEQGLAWRFTCSAGSRELARTAPIRDTRGQWRQMDLVLSVPADCGAVVLQLRTELQSEALSGLRGQVGFDAFRLAARQGAS